MAKGSLMICYFPVIPLVRQHMYLILLLLKLLQTHTELADLLKSCDRKLFKC